MIGERKLKNLISYFDIPIVIILMFIDILVLKRFNAVHKIEEEQLEKEILLKSKKPIDRFALRLQERNTISILLLAIVVGIVIIYNRINGNMPNIFLILKSLIMRKIRPYS